MKLAFALLCVTLLRAIVLGAPVPAPPDEARDLQRWLEAFASQRDESAADRIVAAGERAIPVLIDAITRRGPVRREIRTVLGDEVLEIDCSEAAEQLLGRIGGLAVLRAARILETDIDPMVRHDAYWILSEYRDDDVIAIFRSRLPHATGRDLADIIEFLGEVRDPRDVPLFRSLLGAQEDFHVRLAVHYSLALSGDLDAVVPIIDACERRRDHRGPVYLRRMSGRWFGWDAARWRAWLDGARARKAGLLAARPPRSFQEFCDTLDRLGYSEIMRRPWIAFCWDERARSKRERGVPAGLLCGWLLSEEGDAIEILVPHLVRRRFSSARRTEGGVAYADLAGLTQGQYREIPFLTHVERRLASETFEREDRSEGPLSGAEFPFDDAVEFAVLAYGCRSLGEKTLALAVLDYARETISRRDQEYLSSGWFWAFVCSGIATRMAYDATHAGFSGEPRPALLRRWKEIAVFSDTPEAGDTAFEYERQIAEDTAWKEPSADEWARKTPEERASVWIHLLRDHDSAHSISPGWAPVLGPFGESHAGRTNPADALVAMGWSALPAVIEHLDDLGSTRCLGYWRSFVPESYYLLRVGDACEQVFGAITGLSVYTSMTTAGTMTRDGLAGEAKAIAERWWEEYREKGEVAHLQTLLDSGDRRMRSFAARRLLEIDASTHVARILEHLVRSTDAEEALELAGWVEPHLRPQDRSLFLEFARRGSVEIAVDAARLLWERFRDPEGARMLAARFLRLRDGDEYTSREIAGAGETLQLLAAIGDPPAVREILPTLKSDEGTLRRQAVKALASVRDPLAVAALIPILDEHALVYPDWWNEYVRWCDLAIDSLAKMTGYPHVFTLTMETDERDRFIEAWREWWEARGGF